MTAAPSLAALTADEAVALLPALRELLQDAVASGASVGFLPPLADAEADEYWAGVIAALRAGSRALLVARDDAGALTGTVQLDLPTRANGRHRAEVAKLLVHRRARRQGLGRALMRALEGAAPRCSSTRATAIPPVASTKGSVTAASASSRSTPAAPMAPCTRPPSITSCSDAAAPGPLLAVAVPRRCPAVAARPLHLWSATAGGAVASEAEGGVMLARNDRGAIGWRRRHWLAFGWACAATVTFIAVLALVLLGDTRSLDLAATGVVQRLPTPGVLGLMVGVSWLGYEPQAALLALAATLGLLLRRHPRAALFTALAVLLTRLDAPLKAFADRARPSAALDGILVRGSVGGASFPSGHVFAYTIVGGFLAYFAYTHIERPAPRRLVTGFLLLVIALIGPSRLYLGAHWLTDVLGSYLLGSALLVALLLVYRATGAGERDPAGAAER